MKMIIREEDNKKFRVYFDKVDWEHLCFTGYTLLAAQARARSLLKSHKEKVTNIEYIIKGDK